MQAHMTETHELLAVINPATYSTEQNTDFINISNYDRVTVLINAGDIGTSLACDIEIATNDGGTGLHTLKSITTLTQAAGDDNSNVAINLRGEEFSKPTSAPSKEYSHMRVELTPSGNCIFSVQVWGCNTRYAPVPTTLLDEIVS